MKDLFLNPNTELFHWGPALLRYFFQSDFNIMMGSGYFEKEYPEYMWPKSLAMYKDNRIAWVGEFPELREAGGKAFQEIMMNSSKRKEVREKWENAKKEILEIINKIFDKRYGDILLAPITSPEYIFAMRKSTAIVTDHGGLTSHAAIVSRELHKPCIVGTKFATQVFKDEDIVEIDTDNAIIKKIK